MFIIHLYLLIYECEIKAHQTIVDKQVPTYILRAFDVSYNFYM